MLEVRVWFEGDLEDVQCFVHGPVTVGGVDADVYLPTEEGAAPLFELDGAWTVVEDDRFHRTGGPEVPPEDEGRVVLRGGPWRIEAAVVEPPDPTWRTRSLIGIVPVLVYAVYLIVPWWWGPSSPPHLPTSLALGQSTLLWQRMGPPEPDGEAWSDRVSASVCVLDMAAAPAPPSVSPGAWFAAVDAPSLHVRAVETTAPAGGRPAESTCLGGLEPDALVGRFTTSQAATVEVSAHPHHRDKRLLRVIATPHPAGHAVHEVEVMTNPAVVRTWRMLGSRDAHLARVARAVVVMELVVRGNPHYHSLAYVVFRNRHGTELAAATPQPGSLVDLVNSWAAGRLADGLHGAPVDWLRLRATTTDPALRQLIDTCMAPRLTAGTPSAPAVP